MNVGSFDLKLLVVFDAIMSERHLTRAAQRIGMSQPAMSNSLKRLRDLMGDALFVRTAEGLRPTPKAVQISTPVHAALKQLQHAIEPAEVKNARNLSFSIALSEQAMFVVLPKLIERLRLRAPDVRIRTKPKSNLTICSELDLAEVDVGIGVIPKLPRRFTKDVLFNDTYVCVMRSSHALARSKLTPDRFQQAQQVAVRHTLEGGTQIDRYLHRSRMLRRVVVNVSQYQAIPLILGSTDYIACIPQSVASRYSDEFVIKPLPCRMPPMPVVAAWSTVRKGNPAITLLRQAVREAFVLSREDSAAQNY